MTAASSAAHPVRTLREYATALEAGVMVCLADPRPRNIHHLRTTTRRIEGQLALLDLLPSVPRHDQTSRRVRQLLKRFRRAAGEVRDRDVQLDLIDAVVPPGATRALEHGSIKLHTLIEAGRKDALAKLLKLLRRNGGDLAQALERLLEPLEPAGSLAISAEQLSGLAHEWFAKSAPPEPEGGHEEQDDPEHLHAIRKAAKLARYIAENAPKSARKAHRVARAFEELQQAGGRWHDWLILAALAGDRLGAASPLTKSFEHRCRLALAAYQRRLSASPA